MSLAVVGARTVVGARVRSETIALAAILVSAAVVRLAYLIELWHSPLFLLNMLPGLDMATYYTQAQAFAQAQVPYGGASFQGPLYPLLLAALARIGGQDVAMLTAAQALLGVAACALLFELGRRLICPPGGLLAAGLYAAYPLSWYYSGLLLSENLLVVLLLALALAARSALEGLEGGGTKLWLMIGVLCGLGTLTKANVVLTLPILVGAAYALRAITTRKALAAACACALVLLPAVGYNSLAAGSPQFVSAQGSHLWAAGNSAFATGLYQLPCGPTLAAWDPQVWALGMRKLALFLSNEEFGNNTYAGVFEMYLWLPAIGFGMPAFLGLLGLLGSVPWSRRWLVLVLVLASYVLGIVPFVVVGRYRLPAAALLCLPAAALLVRFRDVQPRRAAIALAAVAALTLVANTQLPPDVSVPFAHANAATVFAAAGETQTAQAEMQRAHTSRLEVEARDPHGCSQLPAF